MKARSIVAIFFCGSIAAVSAQEMQPQAGMTASAEPRLEWNTDLAYWDRFLSQRAELPGWRMGGSDYVLRGPLIEGLRRTPPAPEISPGRRLLNLPVVRLFVPQRMPSPPGGTGRYFAWGESSRPWVSIASGAPAHSSSDPVNREPQAVLISVGR